LLAEKPGEETGQAPEVHFKDVMNRSAALSSGREAFVACDGHRELDQTRFGRRGDIRKAWRRRLRVHILEKRQDHAVRDIAWQRKISRVLLRFSVLRVPDAYGAGSADCHVHFMRKRWSPLHEMVADELKVPTL
jgi:hypothetical protein